MEKIIVTIGIIFLNILGNQLFAQQEIKAGSTFTMNFTYPDKKVPEKIVISTNPNLNYWDSTVDYTIIPGKNNSFKFELPVNSALLLFNLVIYKGGKFTKAGRFYAQPGDRIQIMHYGKSNGDTLIFTGHGSEKYNLANQLQNKYYDYVIKGKNRVPTPKHFSNPDSLISFLIKLSEVTSMMSKNKYEMISRFPNVEPNVKNLFDHEYAQYNSVWFSDISYIYKYICKGKLEQQQQIRTYFNDNYKGMIYPSDEISLQSPFHFQTVNHMLKTALLINSGEIGIDLITYYQNLKDYSADLKIRETLLSQFLMSPSTLNNIAKYDPKVYDSLVSDLGNYLLKPKTKNLLNQKLLFKSGSDLFDADFVDLKQRKINTASLRGKVVLVDGWGEGCTGCARFHTRFEKDLWPILKSNKDFELLAIHTGPSEEGWIRGMDSQRYTSEDYLNVSSLPLGINHPFYKHYQVNYSPFLLLVDKEGKIITKLTGAEKSEDLLALINSALVKKRDN